MASSRWQQRVLATRGVMTGKPGLRKWASEAACLLTCTCSSAPGAHPSCKDGSTSENLINWLKGGGGHTPVLVEKKEKAQQPIDDFKKYC